MARSFVGLHGSPQWGVNEPKHAWAKDVRFCLFTELPGRCRSSEN